jgi:LPXTG-motif cell wall-anchored protein
MWKLVSAVLVVLGTSTGLMAMSPCATAVKCTWSAPEIDPAIAIAAMTLLGGAALIIRGRRKK